MAEPIGPGTQAECVNAAGAATGKLVLGAIYTVATVVPDEGGPYFELEETGCLRWCVWRFRSYRPGETAAHLFAHHLKQPAPTKETVEA